MTTEPVTLASIKVMRYALEEIAAMHGMIPGGDVCKECLNPYPCDSASAAKRGLTGDTDA